MRITRLTSDHFRIPYSPGRVSLNDPNPIGKEIDLLVIRIETEEGLSGLGFTPHRGPGVAAVRQLVHEQAETIEGEDPRGTERLFSKVESWFRPIGFGGLASRAYSAIDIALWDMKAKAANVPLFKLLGGAKSSAPFFLSDIASIGRSATDVVRQASPWIQQGAMGVRVEIGTGDVRADADRVREISDGLGEKASVSVAADGRFDLGTAEALTHFFEDIGIDWFEDPIPAADEIGYGKLANLAEIPLAVGSSFTSREQFFRVIRSGLVRTIRPDISRLGGISPVLKIAAVAEAFQVAVSPVRLPELGIHLACGLSSIPHVDYVTWCTELFTGGPRIENGKLVPSTESGLGFETNEDIAAKWRVK